VVEKVPTSLTLSAHCRNGSKRQRHLVNSWLLIGPAVS
jgi:hypothetical protein